MSALKRIIALLLLSGTTQAALLQVGPSRTYKTPCQASAAAQSGDLVQIDAGTYNDDACYWAASNLTIQGVGGRASLVWTNAANPIPNGKGIWVIDGSSITVENIEFSGATVTSGNGAGIRAEGSGWTVRNCYFHNNEDGILESNVAISDILIEYTEFFRNGLGDGQTHNVYIGTARSLTFQYNYSHQAKVGHELKSRAATNYILYNRIMNEATGTGSYEIDLPIGGASYIIGNLVEQGPNTGNSAIITFAEEGASNAVQELYVINNTVVNDLGSGTFVRVSGSPAVSKLVNNIFWGGGTVLSGPGTQTNNLTANPLLVDQANYDYHLQSGSPAIDAGTNPGTAGSVNLMPVWQYVQPTNKQARNTVGSAIDIGAYEFGLVPPPPPTFSVCDANQDGSTNVVDVQLSINQALKITSCTADINLDGKCDVIDVQRIINAALGGPCVSP